MNDRLMVRDSSSTQSITSGTRGQTVSAEYAIRRAEDWATFTAGSGPGGDHWAQWAQHSHDWKNTIEFLQPVGLDYPSYLDPLEPLLDTLRGLEEVDLPPMEFTHLTMLRLGFMMSTDILWSQVESFYANAAPRIHRIAPFSVRFRGISAHDNALYIGVDDDHAFREVRRQVKLGVAKASEAMTTDPDVTSQGDGFRPVIPFAYFTGRGDRRRVIEAVASYREVDLGEHAMTHIKMGRVSSDPDIHYPPIDVVAEMGLLGAAYRTGYHN
jgi:hypothetical protein